MSMSFRRFSEKIENSEFIFVENLNFLVTFERRLLIVKWKNLSWLFSMFSQLINKLSLIMCYYSFTLYTPMTLVRANLTSKLNYKRSSRLIFSVLFSYFLFILYLLRCTLPNFPSVSSLASLPVLPCCHRTTTTATTTIYA